MASGFKLKALQPRIANVSYQRVAPLVADRVRGRGRVDRNRAFLEAHPWCAECERQALLTPAIEVDHIKPLHLGGIDGEPNLQGLCHDCHARKTSAEQASRSGHCPP